MFLHVCCFHLGYYVAQCYVIIFDSNSYYVQFVKLYISDLGKNNNNDNNNDDTLDGSPVLLSYGVAVLLSARGRRFSY